MTMIGVSGVDAGEWSPDKPRVNCGSTTVVLIEIFQWIGGLEHSAKNPEWVQIKCVGLFVPLTLSVSV